MDEPSTRRRFLRFVTCGLVGVGMHTTLTRGTAIHAQPATPATNPASPPPFDKGPAIDADLARQIVGESHRNLAKVSELVAADPELVNACWDWGGGDYETPLGAAAHTGQREIARFLLDGGARLDIFAATMLGLLDVVRAAIETEPTTRYALGPHGIPLLQHAIAGGEEAQGVRDYLEALYAADTQRRDLPLSPRAVRRYLGRFAEQSDSNAVHEFREESGRLQRIAPTGAAPLALAHRGNHEFVPLDEGGDGAPSIRLRFTLRQSYAQAVAIVTATGEVQGTRVG